MARHSVDQPRMVSYCRLAVATVCTALSARAATDAHWVRAVRPAGCGAMGERQVQIPTLSQPVAARLDQGGELAVRRRR